MTAIYVRQSVERAESVSLETQIEYCKNELRGDNFEVYEDKGFSGKNTKRPAFQKLMQDVEKGNIKRIIVYRIDRFSRNLADFANTYEFLSAHNVELVSSTERFDTSSPIGKAMLGIIMIFAQMERETTVGRIKDNYYKRGELGLFVGGYPHLGFITVPTTKCSMKTKKFEVVPNEAKIVVEIYDRYFCGQSRGKILDWLNEKKPDGKTHSDIFVKDILRNVIYVKSNNAVIKYLKNKGTEVVNPDDKRENAGLFIYGNKFKSTKKHVDLTGAFLQIALHDGIISADIWLAVQRKLDKDNLPRNTGKGKSTWLSGLMRCEYCQMHVSTCGNLRYLNCGGRKKKMCKLRKPFPTVDLVENFVEKELLDFMKNFNFKSEIAQDKNSGEIAKLELELSALEREIDVFVDSFPTIENLLNSTAAQNFKNKIETLCERKNQVEERINRLTEQTSDMPKISENIKDYLSKWDTIGKEEKNKIVRIFVKNIFLKDEEIRIVFIL
ncbi:resolvase [Clostridia bacterium]|nr:resolvase [Clostridia bacterium]